MKERVEWREFGSLVLIGRSAEAARCVNLGRLDIRGLIPFSSI